MIEAADGCSLRELRSKLGLVDYSLFEEDIHATRSAMKAAKATGLMGIGPMLDELDLDPLRRVAQDTFASGRSAIADGWLSNHHEAAKFEERIGIRSALPEDLTGPAGLKALEAVGLSSGLTEQYANLYERSADHQLEQLRAEVSGSLDRIRSAHGFEQPAPGALSRGLDPEIYRIPEPQADIDRREHRRTSEKQLEFTEKLIAIFQASREEAHAFRAEDRVNADQKDRRNHRIDTLTLVVATAALFSSLWPEGNRGTPEALASPDQRVMLSPAPTTALPSSSRGYALPPVRDQILALCKAPLRC